MDINACYQQIKAMAEFANKELGQNYLTNPKIAEKMVELLDIKPTDNVLEVGAGFGALSVFLLDSHYKTITLNEVDPRAVSYLDDLVEHARRAYVVNKSALKLDAKSYNKVIGNLPYYITNDLLEHFFAKCDAERYIFMVQKEVLNRLVCHENTADYGPLAILVNYLGEIKKEFDVGKENFLPTPHIASTVFSLNKKAKQKIDKYQYLQFLKRMFLHRRKTIYNNLSLYLMNKEKAKKILDDLKISILTRPEQITPKTYLSIFRLTIC
ncbi:MAG: 16S rRNA (adenine(1518)-N(6)/adenine(1519)-N(6))-dimethyltransferase RsmA [Bacilli bacterium]|nr:16S rRNA (adenine(1518)-N(6)/adenine(1519)-N(6))-dimethyltransferase RsmA [Bacilli bacterium]